MLILCRNTDLVSARQPENAARLASSGRSQPLEEGQDTMRSHPSLPPGSTRTGYNYSYAFISPELIVDNWNNSYALVWDGSTTQELCYMQVGFTVSSYAVALPMIKK
jgi:hypothetical protein